MTTAKRTVAQIDAEIAATKEALANVHGSETEVYARIVGYYRSVRNWNKGKRDEFNSRKMFEIDETENTYEISNADSCCDCSAVNRVTQEENAADAGVEGNSNIVRYELFARATCPNCPPVKTYVANLSVPGAIIDVDSSEGLADAAKKGVLAAPTVIVYGKDGNEIARAHNVEELEEIFEPVTVAAV